MHLYSTLQQEMGRKSLADYGSEVLGSKINLVPLVLIGNTLVLKICLIAEHTKGPVCSHVDLKNPLLKPSGPGDLMFGMEKIVDLIS